VDPHRLVGTWDFQREVHDHLDGAEYTALGQAEFALQDDGRVRWAEHGTLSWSAGTTPVWRTLFLVREPPGDVAAASGWRVTFEDGRDFHPWTVGAVEHLCGRDLYRGGVAVPPSDLPPPDLLPLAPPPLAPPPSDLPWELHWRVTGPEKDYTMDTHYSRPPR
jgi:hypothetical protein